MLYLKAIVPIVALILMILAGRLFDKRRTSKLAAVAGELSLSFAPQASPDVEAALHDKASLFPGHIGTAANVISGQAQSVQLSVFDYSSKSSDDGKSFRNTVVMFDSPSLNLPTFKLQLEGLVQKAIYLLGNTDINIDGYPAFNSRFFLWGPDEAAVRELFTEEVVQFFEQEYGKGKAFGGVYGAGSRLLVRVDPRVKPDEIRPLLDRAFEIYGLFKPSEEHGLTHPLAVESISEG